MTESNWRRLHPLTILKELGALAWAVVGAFVIDFDSFEMPDEAILPEALAAAIVFLIAIARYFFTSYRMTDQAIELRRGVIVKSFQSMPRVRVQSVGNTTGLLGRFLGVTTVEISAADGEDIRVGFVSEEDASHLRRALERDDGHLRSDDDRFTRDGPWLGSLEPKRLAIFGLTDPSFAAIALVGGAVAVPSFYLGAYLAPLSLLPFFVWPFIRTFALFDHHSWLDVDRVRIEAGLLTRHRTESPIDRIQLVQVQRPWLRRLIGFETVSMATADVSVSVENKVAGGIVSPLESIGGWRPIAEQLIGHVGPGETSLRRSSRLAIRRTIVRGAVLGSWGLGAIAAGAWWLGSSMWIPGLVAVVYGAGLTWYARRRWQLLGWAVDTEHLLVRRGVVSIKLVAVPVRKVQNVMVASTWFQRRLGLASVVFDTAGTSSAGSVRAIDLEQSDARWLGLEVADRAAAIALPDGV